MKLIEELKNFEPETETNKMQIKIKNEVTAWVLRNKIERQGFPVEITKERNHFILTLTSTPPMSNIMPFINKNT